MIKWLARPADYLSVWRDMQAYTDQRSAETPDEIWLCEHAPVYTLGQAGLPEHVLNPGAIPLVQCDRGGQVAYHGPGQVMAYALFDLRRVDMYVKEYVALLETAVIDTLDAMGVAGACRKPGAPGVYVPDPDGGREVVHRVDALQGFIDLRAVVDVADDQFDFLRQVLGPSSAVPVHLGVQ